MTPLPCRANDIIDNFPGKNVLPGPCRVLGFRSNAAEVWLIAIPGKSTKHPNRKADYAKGPFLLKMVDVHAWLDSGTVHVHQLKPDTKLQLSTSCLDAVDEKVADRLKRDISERDKKLQVVYRLLGAEGNGGVPPAALVLADRAGLRKRKRQSEKDFGITRATANHWLHLYWAGGSQANALLDQYGRCGNPGVQKPQSCKLGRGSRPFAQGKTSSKGYVLTDEDKERLAQGYALVSPQKTLMDSFLLTSSVYWANHAVDSRGETVATLFEKIDRPTIDQFKYWGKKLTKKFVKDLFLTPQEKQRREARGGSVRDQVVMVGQRGCFDATSTDVYLVSLRGRLKKLPAMTRSMIKETRTDLILGVYCGWDAPSSRTALKTLLHAASDKVEFCARFGIKIKSEDWPAMLPRTILADNGELKAKEPTEAETQFGFSIELAPTHQGQSKAEIETQHHADHKKLDHKIPGSTGGRRRNRGESHRATEGLWNYYEYMREQIKHIIEHNTIIEIPDLAPTEMLVEDPHIRPTRLNIFNWLRDRGMSLDVPVDVDVFRAFTLPDWPAVIKKNGLYLEANILGWNSLVPRLRFSSDEFVKSGLMAQVKRTGKTIKAVVKFDQEDLSKVWLRTQSGLIPLFNCCRDAMFLQQMTLTDWLPVVKEILSRTDADKGKIEQYEVDKLLRKKMKSDTATEELRKEIDDLGGRPSKSSLTRNLRQNRVEEMQLLEAMQRQLDGGEDALQVAGDETQMSEKMNPECDPMSLLMAEINRAELGND